MDLDLSLDQLQATAVRVLAGLLAAVVLAMAFALASLLEDRGLDVVFSETGREALEILSTDPRIDLVLMDIMMPQMDGYETIRAARAMPALRTLPIIAVTAKAMQGDREKSIAAGASDYITKPVDPDKLISLVNGWLCV